MLVDICDAHGTWLSRGDLDIVLDAISAGLKWVRPGRIQSSSSPSRATTTPVADGYDLTDAARRAKLRDVQALASALIEAARREDVEAIAALAEKLQVLARTLPHRRRAWE